MLSAIARAGWAPRAFGAALITSVRPSSSLSRQLLTTLPVTSLLRPSAHLSFTSRLFAHAARSQSASKSVTELPSSSTDPTSPSTAASSASSGSVSSDSKAAPRRPLGRTRLPAEQKKAAEKRAKQLLQAKQQERAKKDRERSVATRLKQQQRRIVKQEQARERATLTKQRRQVKKDELRAKAAEKKARQAEEKSVERKYKAQQSTRPKRPFSPYIAFLTSQRSQLPKSDVSAKPTEVTKLLAGRWHQLTAAEKSKYEAEHKAALPAYERAMQKWNEEQRAKRPPTRPASSYARFAQRRIKEMRAAEGGGSQASVLMKRVAAEWKETPAEGKAKLQSEQRGEMEAYRQRLAEWEKGPAEDQAMWKMKRTEMKKKKQTRQSTRALNKQTTGSGSQAATATAQ